MTPSKTEHELEELLRAATPLPWFACTWDPMERPHISMAEGDHHPSKDIARELTKPNAELAVAAVNALPDLLAERKRLRELAEAIVDYDNTTKVAVHETGDLDAVLEKWRRVTDLARSLLPISDDSLAFAVKSQSSDSTPRTPNPDAVRRIVAHLWGEDIVNLRAAVESFANGWTVVEKAEASPAASGDALREALADANRIIAMTRQHLSEDHPDCAWTALGVMNDSSRAALAASPPLPEGLDVERLAEAIRNIYIAPSASREMDAENIAREYARLASREGAE